MLEKFFKISERNSTVRTEVMAGVTTFVTMAYILLVCPSAMKVAGVDPSAVFVATALSSAFATLIMALLANYPFALAPGVGSVAFFVYSVCIGMGVDYKVALLAVFVEGILFMLMRLGKIRSAIFNAIPLSMKYAVSVGLGLFISFIGLQNAKIIVKNDATLVAIENFSQNFYSVGIGGVLALLGVFIIGVLMIRKVPGAMLLGMIIVWILTMLLETFGIYIPNPELGTYSSIPHFASGVNFGPFVDLFGQVFKADISAIGISNFVVIVLTFLFVDVFDTLGTIMGVASKADLLNKDGSMDGLEPALMSDAVATTAGAVLGVPTTTTYVESASGIASGGRTGLTALVCSILFLVSLIFMPIFAAIPSFVTSSALLIVGYFMIDSVKNIDLLDPSEGIPAFLCLVTMPLSYSIADGIGVGLLSYTIINFFGKAENRKKISAITYVVSILYVCKFIFL